MTAIKWLETADLQYDEIPPFSPLDQDSFQVVDYIKQIRLMWTDGAYKLGIYTQSQHK